MYAYGAHFDASSAQSVFCDVHAAAENDLNYFFAAAKKLCEALSTYGIRPAVSRADTVL